MGWVRSPGDEDPLYNLAGANAPTELVSVERMILHYLPATPDSFAPRRACSVEAMIALGALWANHPLHRASSAGAPFPGLLGQVVQNRRPTEQSSEEAAGSE